MENEHFLLYKVQVFPPCFILCSSLWCKMNRTQGWWTVDEQGWWRVERRPSQADRQTGSLCWLERVSVRQAEDCLYTWQPLFHLSLHISFHAHTHTHQHTAHAHSNMHNHPIPVHRPSYCTVTTRALLLYFWVLPVQTTDDDVLAGFLYSSGLSSPQGFLSASN